MSNDIDDYGNIESAGYKNIIAIRDYTKTTRELFRKLEEEIKLYKNQILQQSIAIEELNRKITYLQIQIQGNKKTT